MQTDTSPITDQYQVDKDSLVELYTMLSPRLFQYAVRLLGDADLAEDCVSETFSRFLAVTNKGMGPRENARAYLYRIAHNWVTDYYRQNKPEESIEAVQMASASGSPAVEASQNLDRQRVRKALLDLPEDQRQVVMLRFYEEWSHEATAVAIGKTVEATRALQYRALNSLRKMLIAVED